MSRNTQLIQLIQMVREEVNRSASVAVGVDDQPLIRQKLQRTQEFFYDEFTWPFLRQVFPLKQLNQGEQYYDFPTSLNLERVEGAHVWYGLLPQPLDRGIGMEQYAVYNSNLGITSEPALRWDVRWTGQKEQFEIWPIPASQTQQIQFTGIRDLRPLVSDSDVADLDDRMIVLAVAAEILAAQGNANASSIGALAMERFLRMKGRANAGAERMRRMGQSAYPRDRRFPITVHARAGP